MFQDKRAKKVAIVANCLLNQNAKVGALADYPAQVPGVVELLAKYDFGIEQLPCPETYSAGLRRFWQVKPQYQCCGPRRSFGFLADVALDCVEDYIRHGFTMVLIGVDGSPSCGVNITDSDDRGVWIGKPCFTEEEANDDSIFKQGQGAFIEIIQTKLKERGLAPIPAFGLSLDIQGSELDFTGLEDFLKQFS